jgi:hypothetical protein
MSRAGNIVRMIFAVALSGICTVPSRGQAAPPTQSAVNEDIEGAAQVRQFGQNGFTMTAIRTGLQADVTATMDIDVMKASHSFWKRYVDEAQIASAPFSVAFSLEKVFLLSVLHATAALDTPPDLIHARIAMKADENGSPVEHVGYEFTYNRDLDGKIYREDLSAVPLPSSIPNTALTPWLAGKFQEEQPKPALTVEDLLLDKGLLKDKTVSVSGYTACSGSTATMCMLYSDPMNFTKNIFYDASNASRADRSILLSCTIVTGCKVTIRGVVVDNPLGTIDITSMQWENRTKPPEAADQAGAAVAASDRRMGVKDFLLDSRLLANASITVVGTAQCSGSTCWLTEAGWLSQQIASFNADSLSRDDRKRLLDCNQAFSSGCDVEVSGRVTSDTSINATAIRWH